MQYFTINYIVTSKLNIGIVCNDIPWSGSPANFKATKKKAFVGC
jgi:hypothetical protein